jgi:alcohol dehydrogenase
VLPAALAERRADDLQRLLEASAIANLSCGSAGLGLVHALDSAPGVTLAHGYQNGVLLPHVAAFNDPVLRPEVRAEVVRLNTLYAHLGFTPRFAAGELAAEQVERIVAAVSGHQFQLNNGREATEADVRAILASAGAARA